MLGRKKNKILSTISATEGFSRSNPSFFVSVEHVDFLFLSSFGAGIFGWDFAGTFSAFFRSGDLLPGSRRDERGIQSEQSSRFVGVYHDDVGYLLADHCGGHLRGVGILA